MNKLKYILPSVLLAGALVGCNDLDTEPMGSIITEDQREDVIKNDPSAIDGISSGVYANYTYWQGAYTGSGNSGYIDFGLAGLFIQWESRTADFVSAGVSNYGWFEDCVAYQDNTATAATDQIRWNLNYNTIYSANQVIGSIEAGTDNDVLKFYRAQALGNRAYCYFLLAQMYQFTYVGNESKPCVPIITDENQNEAAENGAPRASVAEVYAQILSDLGEALSLVEGNAAATRVDKSYIDKNVLLAIRARVHLCMGLYDQAAADAQAVINSGQFTPLSVNQVKVPGFNLLSSANWIWGIKMTYENTPGLYTWPGFIGSYCYGYCSAATGMYRLIDDKLFNQIPVNDPRRLWWIEPGTRNCTANYYTDAVGGAAGGLDFTGMTAAEYLDAAEIPDYAAVKIAPFQNQLFQSNNEGDVPIIRIEEMYYILAEAQGLGSAGLGQGAQTLNNFVNQYRWEGSPAYACSANGTEDFINSIWLQRRVEFWGEGINYFDLLRLKKPMDRTGSENWSNPANALTGYIYNIEPTNPVLISQIPSQEMQNNTALSDADQNPTGQPTK